MIINLFDLEKEFPNKLPDAIEGYYSSGARDEVTLKRNRSIFDEYELLPKFLKDVSNINTKTKILNLWKAMHFKTTLREGALPPPSNLW